MNASGPRQKILIVDDNKQNIEMLMAIFRRKYKIAAAVNGERALKIAQSDAPPDIILLDILMPGMDGYEICRRLKADSSTRSIPIIFVTAVSEVMDEAHGFELGAVDYITKPFHPPIITARVGMHLKLKRKQELLEKFAFIDSLTEIPNRRRFDEVIQKEWHRAGRSGKSMSLMMIDIDYFKQYNDTYGHGQGDRCLRQVARAIESMMQRAGDFVARYGGEEFAVVLPYTKLTEAMDFAKRIRRHINALNIAHSQSSVADHVTISIGVAAVDPHQSLDTTQIVEAADSAMYQAKKTGRNRICSMQR